jgi:hypothetical protein
MTSETSLEGASAANSSAAAGAGGNTWDLYSGPQRWTYLSVLCKRPALAALLS